MQVQTISLPAHLVPLKNLRKVAYQINLDTPALNLLWTFTNAYTTHTPLVITHNLFEAIITVGVKDRQNNICVFEFLPQNRTEIKVVIYSETALDSLSLFDVNVEIKEDELIFGGVSFPLFKPQPIIGFTKSSGSLTSALRSFTVLDKSRLIPTGEENISPYDGTIASYEIHLPFDSVTKNDLIILQNIFYAALKTFLIDKKQAKWLMLHDERDGVYVLHEDDYQRFKDLTSGELLERYLTEEDVYGLVSIKLRDFNLTMDLEKRLLSEMVDQTEPSFFNDKEPKPNFYRGI